MIERANETAIALIPARGGSKGIPLKNLVTVGGRSLLAHAVAAARDSGAVERIVVSSDSDAILQEAGRLGAVALRRPAEISTDTASSDSVIDHCIAELGLKSSPARPLVLLQPTSPLRTGAHVAEGLRIWKGGDAACVISVTEPAHHPAKSFRLDDNGFLTGLFGADAPFTPRQALPRAFEPNGAVYIFSIAAFLAANRIPRQRIAPLVMQRHESLDIDTPEDLAQAESYFRREH